MRRGQLDLGVVTYGSPFIPPEWIAAHGLRPCRLAPAAPAAESGAFGGMGVCPFCRAYCLEAVTSAADAVIFATECDQMRRAAERVEEASAKPVFLFNMPATWETASARGLYADELRRLGRFLESLGGMAPSLDNLADVMAGYGAARAELLSMRGRLSPRAFSEAIVEFQLNPDCFTAAALPSSPPPSGIPLILLGPELYRDHYLLFDLIDQSGGWVALDATASGERGLPAPFDRRLLREDPFGVLVQSYFDGIPDAFRRPNSALYQWLKREIAARGARGILLRVYQWCDTWKAEARRLKDWSPIPVQTIDVADEGAVDGRVSSRVQAFLEALR